MSTDTINKILEIFNHIWQNDIYPSQWNKVIVTAILKPGKDKTSLDNIGRYQFQKVLRQIEVYDKEIPFPLSIQPSAGMGDKEEQEQERHNLLSYSSNHGLCR